MHLPGPRAPFRLTTGAAPAPAAPRAVPSAPQGATRADEIRLHRSPDAAFAATAALREEFVRGAPRFASGDVAGMKDGDLVSFPIDGRRLVGRITSIRRRATVEVLSPCPDGGPAHLHKYGVPVHLLERADAGTTA